jgi:uncharacterized membrane protein
MSTPKPFLVLTALLYSSVFAHKVFSEEISFNRDVRPILSGKCFHCHGPSEKFRKADLRLDLPEEAFFEKDGLAAFVPESTEDSEAWHRIMSDDPEEVMPPPEIKKEMTEREKEIITKWIEQGAKWEGHWSISLCKKNLRQKVPIPNGLRAPSIFSFTPS